MIKQIQILFLVVAQMADYQRTPMRKSKELLRV